MQVFVTSPSYVFVKSPPQTPTYLGTCLVHCVEHMVQIHTPFWPQINPINVKRSPPEKPPCPTHFLWFFFIFLCSVEITHPQQACRVHKAACIVHSCKKWWYHCVIEEGVVRLFVCVCIEGVQWSCDGEVESHRAYSYQHTVESHKSYSYQHTVESHKSYSYQHTQTHIHT